MKVAFKESVLYYDCEMLFEAEDETGRRYIAVHDNEHQNGSKYIMVPVTEAGLVEFKAGQIGLRSLLLASPNGEWYTTKMGVDTDGMTLIRQPTSITDHLDFLYGITA